jgi:hypothetical protein
MELLRILRLCVGVVMIMALVYLFMNGRDHNEKIDVIRHNNDMLLLNRLQNRYREQYDEDISDMLKSHKSVNSCGYFDECVHQDYLQNNQKHMLN